MRQSGPVNLLPDAVPKRTMCMYGVDRILEPQLHMQELCHLVCPQEALWAFGNVRVLQGLQETVTRHVFVSIPQTMVGPNITSTNIALSFLAHSRRRYLIA